MPYGHPDLLVQRATAIGVVDPVDEQPHIEVRLGGKPIEPIADRLGISVDALRMRLGRIDTRLATALAAGALSDSVSPEAARAMMTAADRRAAIRAGRTTTIPTGVLPAAA